MNGIFIGALAACGAVTFSNPFEVIKTRLQLQGELEAKNTHKKQVYRNPISSLYTIVRNEGVKGVQKGLSAAYMYQFVYNGLRLGLYDPLQLEISHFFNRYAPATPTILPFIISGAVSGAVGASVSSPFFLMKTRMQSYSANSTAVVGHQHSYVTKGPLKALAYVYQKEGFRGLYRGWKISTLRTAVGSSVQLSSYSYSKQLLINSGLFDTSENAAGNGVTLHFSASALTSVFVALAMNPFDVAATRMQNQKVAGNNDGALYKNGFDVFAKTIRTEGFMALYKGLSANLVRIAPHTILTFVFLEQLKYYFGGS